MVKPESAFAFTTSLTPVEAIAHVVPVSAQVFEDAGTLSAFLNSEMIYGLEAGIEDQIVNGTGGTGQLSGLLASATAYTGTSPARTNEIDILRDAIMQISLADYDATAIILNPSDWFDVEVRKVGPSSDSYQAGAPRLMGGQGLFGIPVISSNTIASGTFLIGDFDRAALAFERTPVTLEISRQDSSNFQRNMVTVRAEQRLALVVANPTALVTGNL